MGKTHTLGHVFGNVSFFFSIPCGCNCSDFGSREAFKAVSHKPDRRQKQSAVVEGFGVYPNGNPGHLSRRSRRQQ